MRIDLVDSVLRSRPCFIGSSLSTRLVWLLAVAVVVTGATAMSARGKAETGHDFTLSGFNRADARVSDFRGQVLVIHFWATWCKPCRREIPSLAAFHKGAYQNLRKEGLSVITVSNDVREKDLHRFLREHHLPFPVFFDSLGRIRGQLEIFGLPATVVMNRDGQIIDVLQGEQDWQGKRLHDRFAVLLAR